MHDAQHQQCPSLGSRIEHAPAALCALKDIAGIHKDCSVGVWQSAHFRPYIYLFIHGFVFFFPPPFGSRRALHAAQVNSFVQQYY